MALFEITITGSKQFYIEAETEEEAVGHEFVADEMCHGGDFEWEADTAVAREQSEDYAEHIRKHHADDIVT